ncbi:GNAT family N-acetyltransferase [Halobacillus sp. Marseille-Q1614]|uniref:GNAT family N-acetyltransferase n=1 Tax=Halobacillus sp. Marseille-Q1614 TaxID=2709134 RepID=UPI001570B932|nr:GNAT family N-acetyltransferase [Halobacillus sp. Marseille-Q1614]
MNFRILTGKDAKAYRELRLEALLNSPDAFITTYEQEKQRPNPIESTANRLVGSQAKTIGCFADERLVGNATLLFESHPKYKHKASIVGVYVTPSHRRNKVAQLLIEECIKTAKAREIKVLQLAVVTDNQPALLLYKSTGFSIYGTEHRAVKIADRYMDEHWMEYFTDEN